MEKVKVLNANGMILNEISWRRAICLIEKGKAEACEFTDRVIRTINRIIRVPSMIRLLKLVRVVFKRSIPYTKRNIFIRDNHTCIYCGKGPMKHNQCTVDHVIPRSRGGKSSWENCVTSCLSCNNKKGDKTPSEAKMAFRGKKPNRPTIAEFTMMKYGRL